MNDENYVLVVNQKLPERLEEFKEVEDKRVLWDLIKHRIRQFTLRYSKENARKRKQELLHMEISLKQAEEMLAADPSETNLERLKFNTTLFLIISQEGQ